MELSHCFNLNQLESSVSDKVAVCGVNGMEWNEMG